MAKSIAANPHALLKLKARQLAELEENAAGGCASAAKALPALRRQVEALTKAAGLDAVEAPAESDDAAQLRAENERLKVELQQAQAAKAAPAGKKRATK